MMAGQGNASLLIELGTEELPPKALDELSIRFAENVQSGLAARGIATDANAVRRYCSPRRLAAWIPHVPMQQQDQKSEVLGPYLTVGLDANGAPTPALTGFAAKNGLAIEALQRLTDAKGERFVARSEKPGQPTAALLPEIINEALKALPIPKPMRWSDHDYAFVRPVHWLVVLHGSEVVNCRILGLDSGRHSRGHRFLHADAIEIASADGWLEAMREAKVLADPDERRHRIRDEVARAALATGGNPRLSAGLLDEIANLTEWPVAIACRFDPQFLRVPQEALIMTMETNQKFVPVFDAEDRLSEHFIGVANIESRNPAEIRKGYERVIRPRFADAQFFYDEDRKQGLAAFQDSLQSVTYQQALGSVWDKCIRVAELARVIANRLGVDAGLATRAAALSKCDLMTRMVGEFPELQGVMGRYYASQGEPTEKSEVAVALDEFYRPRQSGDAIASTPVGQVLAIAERVDTLAGIFAVGMKPSGNKDPFALRRAALGLARTLIEAQLDIDLKAHFAEALANLPDSAFASAQGKSKEGQAPALDLGKQRAELGQDLYAFVLDRMRSYYLEQGIPAEAFEAVRVLAPPSMSDFDRRLRALVEFTRLPEAQALAAANKRIGNILRQANLVPGGVLDDSLLEAGAERELAHALAQAEVDALPMIGQGDHVGLLRRLASLREPVDHFFDGVMVMVEDERIKSNRLVLLGRLRSLFLRVADISLLPASAISENP